MYPYILYDTHVYSLSLSLSHTHTHIQVVEAVMTNGPAWQPKQGAALVPGDEILSIGPQIYNRLL